MRTRRTGSFGEAGQTEGTAVPDITRTTSAIAAQRSALAAVATVAGVAVLLTGCSASQVGAAAVVDGRRITVQQVSDAVAGIQRGNPQLAQTSGLDRTVLFFLVLSPWLLPAAQDNQVGVSESEARALLPKTTTPDAAAVRVLRTFLALQKLQQAGKTEALAQVQKDVTAARPELNPRYGTFDLKQMAIVDSPPNWLVPRSTPTPTPTPTTTP